MSGTELKVCSKCDEAKPLDEFYTRKYRPGHGGGLYAHCKTCHKTGTVAHHKGAGKSVRRKNVKEYTVRRRVLLWQIKDTPCADCGGRFPPYVMDFDHKDPTQKEFTIAAYLNRVSLERLMAEVAKCDIVCANCHRIRTHGDG